MGLQLLEGFDWIADATVATDLNTISDRKWSTNRDFITGSPDADIDVGVGGIGQSLKMGDTTQSVRMKFYGSTAPISTSEVGMGFHWKATSIDNVDLAGLVDTDGTRFQANLRVVGGRLHLYVGSTLFKDLGYTLVTNEWYFFELKTVVNATTGSYTVRVDGTTIDSGTSVDTSDGGNGVIGFVQFGGFNDCFYDNIYAFDNQGGANDVKDFLGPITVITLKPNADGDDEQWTTSTGTDSFALVDEDAPHDDDTTYIESGTSTNRTLFTYEDPGTPAFTNYYGLQVNTVARETDATNFSLINTFKQNATLYPETSQAISGQTFENYGNVLDVDPDTGTAWTDTGIDALQAGVEVA